MTWLLTASSSQYCLPFISCLKHTNPTTVRHLAVRSCFATSRPVVWAMFFVKVVWFLDIYYSHSSNLHRGEETRVCSFWMFDDFFSVPFYFLITLGSCCCLQWSRVYRMLYFFAKRFATVFFTGKREHYFVLFLNRLPPFLKPYPHIFCCDLQHG